MLIAIVKLAFFSFLGETQPKVAFPVLPSSLSVRSDGRPSVTIMINAY